MEMRVTKPAIVAAMMFACIAAVSITAAWASPMAAAPADANAAAQSDLDKVPRITVEELKKLMDQKSDVIVVDTRDSASYQLSHIKGAVNIYYDPTGDPADREMTLVALPMNKLVVIYCACQNEEESAPMALELYRLGYDHDKVKALRGGSIRWEEVGYPFVSSEEAAKSAAN
jgi:rhodanese-related sulfurtransferase